MNIFFLFFQHPLEDDTEHSEMFQRSLVSPPKPSQKKEERYAGRKRITGGISNRAFQATSNRGGFYSKGLGYKTQKITSRPKTVCRKNGQ